MRPRLFVELCARLASVSLCLQGGARCKPPVSTPGAKVGYAPVILAAAGLSPGQGADGYLWCEPEAGPRSVLAAYTDPAVLQEAAAIIRGWVGEEARPLWDRLRVEERAARSVTPAEHVARWVLLSRWSFSGKGHESGYGGPGCEVRTEKAEWTTADRDEALERPRTARLVEAAGGVAWPAVTIGEDARSVEPGDVARWLVVQAWGAGKGTFYSGPGVRRTPNPADPHNAGSVALPALPALADRAAKAVPWPPILLGPDAREVVPNADLEGCVVYIDPPYAGTTPYLHKLARAEVVDLALRWSAAGALVLVSEAVAVEELVALGWYTSEITAGRRGNARTFGSTREWLTMSREPAHRVGTQVAMWGAA